jgi:4-hydroxy-tetrahydrodipicolinate reductase
MIFRKEVLTMGKIRIGLFGFGKTGKLVANEFLKDDSCSLEWVVRKGYESHHKYASQLLGYEFEAGDIFSLADITDTFFLERRVDAIVDFSSAAGAYEYQAATELQIPIVSAISKYGERELRQLREYAESTAVLYSPNITLGINVLLVAAQILQKIAPHADIEIVEEHFKGKSEVSGTAKKIAEALNLDAKLHVHSIRVGGIVGSHQIIFGMPNQTIRLSHESISRAAFGQGAIFAVKYILQQPTGMYHMENIIAEMFRNHIPVY